MTNRSVSSLVRAVLAAPQALDHVTSDDDVIISTSANTSALKRLQCMGHRLWPAASILAPPPPSLTPPVFYQVSPSTNSAPLHHLSLSLSHCGAHVARHAHFRSHVLRFLAICLSRHRTLSRCAWKDVPKLATSYFLVHGGTQRKLPQCDASTHLFSSP